MRSAMRAARL